MARQIMRGTGATFGSLCGHAAPSLCRQHRPRQGRASRKSLASFHPMGTMGMTFFSDGPEVTVDPLIKPQHVGTSIPEVRFPYSARHRAWKRLVRQRRKLAKPIMAEMAYVMGNRTIMSPRAYDAFKQSSDRYFGQRAREVERSIFGTSPSPDKPLTVEDFDRWTRDHDMLDAISYAAELWKPAKPDSGPLFDWRRYKFETRRRDKPE